MTSTSTLTVFPCNVIGKLARTLKGFDSLPSNASRALGDEVRAGETIAFQQADDMTQVDAPSSTTALWMLRLLMPTCMTSTI